MVSTSAPKMQYTSLGEVAGEACHPQFANKASPSQAYLEPTEGCPGPLSLSVLSLETLQKSFWFYLFFFPPLFNLFNGNYCHSLK